MRARVILVLGTFLFVGCRVAVNTTPIAPAQIAGIYRMERSGQAGGRSWSVRSTLTLSEPDRYELETVVRNRDEDEESEDLESGSFRIERSALFLRNRKNETSELLIRGDSLVGKVGFPGALFVRMVGGPPVYVRQRAPFHY